MKTSRTDVERNKQQTLCPNSTSLGYSRWKLRYGHLFLYKEHYTDGTHGVRLAKCHGRIRPDYRTSGKIDWFILAQVTNRMMGSTYERWIKPEDVIETRPPERCDKNILKYFEEREKIDLPVKA